MITSDQARELAAPHWGAVSSEMEIEEFDLGYVAWRRKPPRPDPTLIPSTIGGTLLVIDKETGEITSWPNISSTGVIEMYRSHKRGEGTRPQGLTRPGPQHQRDLNDPVLKQPGGRAQRFPDPRMDWLRLVNDGGPDADPLRGNNSLDCSLSLISTWHGEPKVSAPRFPDRRPDGSLDKRTGEGRGMARAESWLRQQFEYLGSAMEGFHAIEQKLRAGGHGASAVIVNSWKSSGSAHAWNAVNYNGEVVWVDAQLGESSDKPVHYASDIARIWAIVIDRGGKRL